MAIYHFSVSHGSRGCGPQAAAKCDYVLREGKYATRGDLEHRFSGNMPAWSHEDPSEYFRRADLHERRNGRLYISLIGALPNELTHGECLALVHRFAEEAATVPEGKLPYVGAIHGGSNTKGKPRNRHFHLSLSERALDGHDRTPATWFRRANAAKPEAGGAKKARSVKPRSWVDETRAMWERHANEALEAAGREERVSRLGVRARYEAAKERGDAREAARFDRPIEPKIGPEATHNPAGVPDRTATLERARGLAERSYEGYKLREAVEEERAALKQLESDFRGDGVGDRAERRAACKNRSPLDLAAWTTPERARLIEQAYRDQDGPPAPSPAETADDGWGLGTPPAVPLAPPTRERIEWTRSGDGRTPPNGERGVR